MENGEFRKTMSSIVNSPEYGEMIEKKKAKEEKTAARVKVLAVSLVAVLVIASVAAVLGIRFLGGKHPVDPGDYPKDLSTEDGDSKESEGYLYNVVNADWPVYKTAEEIIDASTNIFTGVVSDISFAVIDLKTGKTVDPAEEGTASAMLHTVYTVTVGERRKGTVAEETKICKIGGLKGYNETEQAELLIASGLAADGSAPVICVGDDDDCTVAIGQEYLFCTSSTSGDFEHIINPWQFAHRLDSENAKLIENSIHRRYKTLKQLSEDFNGDGKTENVEIVQMDTEDSLPVFILKATGAGEKTIDLSLSCYHPQWNSFSLCTVDGKYCILQYCPYTNQGISNYTFVLYAYSETEGFYAADGMSVSFDRNGKDPLPVDSMVSFAEKLNNYLEGSRILISTLEGKLLTEGKIPEEVYSWADEYVSDTGLTLREKLSLCGEILYDRYHN